MLPQYVVAGELDRLLTYPVHTLSFFLVTRPELHAFGNLFTGGVFALEARRGLTGAGARGSRKVLGVMSDRAEERVRR